MKQIKGKYLMVIIAGCGMIGAALGMVTNVAGLFFSPIADELGIGRGNVSMTLTISNLVFAAGGLVMARLVNAKNFKRIVLVGAVGLAGATAGLAAAPNLIVLYALNAIRGFCGGLVGLVTVTTVINNWFRTGVGLVTSIAVGFSGLVGAVISPVLSAVIEAAGWRTGYLTAAALIAVLELPALLLPIAFRPEDVGMEPLGGRDHSTVSTGGNKAFKLSLPLFILAFLFAVSAATSTAFPQHFPGIAGSYGLVAAVGSGMLSVCMVTNTAGKLFFGVLADRVGAKWSIRTYIVLIFTALMLLLFVRSPAVMLVAAGMYGLCYSLATVGTVLLTKDTFGVENYGSVYPKVSLGTTIANAVGFSVIGFLYDGTGAYIVPMLLVCTMLTMAVVITFVLYRKRA